MYDTNIMQFERPACCKGKVRHAALIIWYGTGHGRRQRQASATRIIRKFGVVLENTILDGRGIVVHLIL